MIYEVLLSRLAEYGIESNSCSDPWGSGFHTDDIASDNTIEKQSYSYINDNEFYGTNNYNHAARIRYLIQNEDELKTPICIDCECDAGHVYAIPKILDGWHRLNAHWHLKKKIINATFGGRVDLIEYLTGKTDVKPEY